MGLSLKENSGWQQEGFGMRQACMNTNAHSVEDWAQGIHNSDPTHPPPEGQEGTTREDAQQVPAQA